MEGVTVGLARQPEMQRLQAFSRLQQEGHRVAAATGIGGDLGAQFLGPGPPELVERSRLRYGQQPQSRLRGAGQVLGVRGDQGAREAWRAGSGVSMAAR